MHRFILYLILIFVLLRLIFKNDIIEGNGSNDYKLCFKQDVPPAYTQFNTQTKKDVVRDHIIKNFINDLDGISYLANPNSLDNDILKLDGNDYCYG